MNNWPWGVLFCSAPLVAGCEKPANLAVPPIDLAVPTEIETATFALG